MRKNNKPFQSIVDGEYGRRIAYTDVEEITEDNVVSVVGNTIGTFYYNRPIFEYLWRYKNGDQPTLYRKKTIRKDINNPVVENHAWEIVAFTNAQTNGEPIQRFSLKEDESVNKAVDRYNDYCRAANKHAKDISSGIWTHATGTGFKAVQRVKGENVPIRFVVPTPLNTYIVYQRSTEEPILAVQELKDADGNLYRLCFSDTHEYRIQSGKLLTLYSSDLEVKSRPHAFGGIPIVEYPNNYERISDIELVMSSLDAINNMQSNRMDAVEQFVQSWVKFVNVEIDEETWAKMREEGALVVKSNNGENKADVEIMTQELNQEQTQVAKEDLWNNILSILGIPNKQGNTGGDTQGAVELRNGWDFSKQRAKLRDPYTIEAEKRLDKVAMTIIRQEKGEQELSLTEMDYDVQINHSPQDNMMVKAQVFVQLVQAGIHPLIAIKVCGLWGDSEKVWLMSKPYLDVLYKTIEDTVPDAQLQEQKANEIVNQIDQEKLNNSGENRWF